MFYDNFNKGSFFIKKRYQFRFITHFCGSVIAGAILAMAVFYFSTYREMGETYYQSLFTLHGLKQNMLQAMVFTGSIVAIFVTLAVLAVTLIASHRIAGPIYKIERSLELLGNGDLSFKIRFRRHDAIEGMAEEINGAIENLNAKVSAVIGNASGIKEELRRLKEDPSQSSLILSEKIRLMKKAVSEFKTE